MIAWNTTRLPAYPRIRVWPPPSLGLRGQRGSLDYLARGWGAATRGMSLCARGNHAICCFWPFLREVTLKRSFGGQ